MSTSLDGDKVWFAATHSSEGGVLEIWRNLNHGFVSKGHAAEIIALYPAGEAPSQSPVRHVWKQRPRGPWQYVTALRALVKLMRAEAPAVVFTAMPIANFLVPLAAAFAGRRTKVIVTHHSPLTSTGAVSRALDFLVSSSGLVDRIICVSKAVFDSQPGPAPYRRKSTVVPNALPVDMEQQIERLISRVALPRVATKRVVVAAGRLSPEKNYPTLIRAVALVPNIRLKIAGRGPEEHRLRELCLSLGVDDRIEFLGFLPRGEVLELFAAGDIFAQPSFFEGHSLALVEAAKLGLPLIVSDVASQVEGITDDAGRRCGSVVAASDVAGLAQEIQSLFADAEHYDRQSRLSLHLGAQSSFHATLSGYLDACQPAPK